MPVYRFGLLQISVADEGRDQSAYLFFDSATQAEAAAASHAHVRLDADDPDEVHVDIVPPSQAPSPGFSSSSGPRGFSRNGYHESKSKPHHFPDYLTHVEPEDDPLACRTLFVGNLGVNVTTEELEDIFAKYGKIKDVDIKRPRLGEGNAFAFIRFENLDMAHRAKTEMSGQYVGKYMCKIGYGKQVPTPKVWIGGLADWASQEMLHDEFDRFGAIRELTRGPDGKSAHVEFDTVDAAIAAVERLRGYPLGGPDKRVRVDFVDLDAGFHVVENGHAHGTRKRRLSRGSSFSPP
jgi:hypothetical protein